MYAKARVAVLGRRHAQPCITARGCAARKNATCVCAAPCTRRSDVAVATWERCSDVGTVKGNTDIRKPFFRKARQKAGK